MMMLLASLLDLNVSSLAKRLRPMKTPGRENS